MARLYRYTHTYTHTTMCGIRIEKGLWRDDGTNMADNKHIIGRTGIHENYDGMNMTNMVELTANGQARLCKQACIKFKHGECTGCK